MKVWPVMVAGSLLGGLLFLPGSRAGDAGASGLVVLDAGGKEIKLTSWKFLAGTRHLSWLDKAPAPEPKGNKSTKSPPRGPEYLEFREDKSTTYQDGILTLVPMTGIKKIDFDNDKKTSALTLLAASDKEEVLTGTTRFIGINKITLEADADLGALGSGTLKFQAGVPKGGIRGLRFAAAKPVPAPAGRTALITARDKEKTVHKVQDLVPVYRTAGGNLALHPHLLFKKTVKIDLGNIQKLRHIEPEDKKQQASDFEVTLDDGKQLTLSLLRETVLEDGKTATLVGLVGRVSAGYKLFPPHTIDELRMGERSTDLKK